MKSDFHDGGEDLLSLPYRDRQIIVIGAVNEDYERPVPIKLSDYYSSEVHRANADLRNWLRPKHWTNSKTWGVYGYLFDKLRGKSETDDAQSVRYLRKVAASTVDGVLTFPPGHPLYDVAYAGHPLKPSIYLPVAAFHRILFEEKFIELLRLLSALGARAVEIRYVSGFRTEFSAAGSVSVPVDVPVTIETSGAGNQSRSSTAALKALFEPTSEPFIPEDLAWYDHEPTWNQIARGRLSGGLTKIDMAFRYEDDFGVNGEIALGLESMGFKIGGKFQKYEQTHWNLRGSF